jgi:hypothetical protein
MADVNIGRLVRFTCVLRLAPLRIWSSLLRKLTFLSQVCGVCVVNSVGFSDAYSLLSLNVFLEEEYEVFPVYVLNTLGIRETLGATCVIAVFSSVSRSKYETHKTWQTADRSGSRNPPSCITIGFLSARGTALSLTLRSDVRCLRNLRYYKRIADNSPATHSRPIHLYYARILC